MKISFNTLYIFKTFMRVCAFVSVLSWESARPFSLWDSRICQGKKDLQNKYFLFTIMIILLSVMPRPR